MDEPAPESERFFTPSVRDACGASPGPGLSSHASLPPGGNGLNGTGRAVTYPHVKILHVTLRDSHEAIRMSEAVIIDSLPTKIYAFVIVTERDCGA